MHVRMLYLKNFRNYEERCFSFGPRANLICGLNGKGKTSILEALHLLMTGRSFRASHPKEWIKHNETECRIEAVFAKHGVEQSLRIGYSGKKRRVYYNYTACHSLAALIGILPGVVWLPTDVAIVKGEPRWRRRFLDLLLAKASPLYLHYLTRYQKALQHRNVLLRKRNVQEQEVWEQELARSAGYLVIERRSAIQKLQDYSANIISLITNRQESVALRYRSQCPQNEGNPSRFYHSLYEKMRQRELYLGCTLVGPQRDDIQILLGDQDAKRFASDGQSRSCAAALRFAEWEYLQRKVDETPLMLIDDVEAGLDHIRRAALLKHLEYFQQVFLTATEEPIHFASDTDSVVIAI